MIKKFKRALICTLLTTTSTLAVDFSVTPEELNGYRAHPKMDPMLQRSLKDVGHVFYRFQGVDDESLDTVYRVNPGKEQNQESSGRCWIFAYTQLISEQMRDRFGYEFTLSHNHIAFWDKVERANFYLNRRYEWAQQGLAIDDQRIIDLDALLQDGGEWELFSNIINKYGVVPREVRKETAFSVNSGGYGKIYKQQLRAWGLEIHNKVSEGRSFNKKSFEKIKKTAMGEVYDLLESYLGTPYHPHDEFAWALPMEDKMEEARAAVKARMEEEDDGSNPFAAIFAKYAEQQQPRAIEEVEEEEDADAEDNGAPTIEDAEFDEEEDADDEVDVESPQAAETEEEDDDGEDLRRIPTRKRKHGEDLAEGLDEDFLAREEAMRPMRKKNVLSFTPLTFKEFAGIDTDNYLHVAHLPYLHDDGEYLHHFKVSVPDIGNVESGLRQQAYLLTMEEMKGLARTSIAAGDGVGLGCDVKHFHQNDGKSILDAKYDRLAQVNGLTPSKISKAESLQGFYTTIAHAMYLIGADPAERCVHVESDGEACPYKYGPLWRIRNSWARSAKDLFATEEWLDRHACSMVIQKKHVPASLLRKLEAGGETFVPAHDPFGVMMQ